MHHHSHRPEVTRSAFTAERVDLSEQDSADQSSGEAEDSRPDGGERHGAHLKLLRLLQTELDYTDQNLTQTEENK